MNGNHFTVVKQSQIKMQLLVGFRILLVLHLKHNQDPHWLHLMEVMESQQGEKWAHPFAVGQWKNILHADC